MRYVVPNQKKKKKYLQKPKSKSMKYLNKTKIDSTGFLGLETNFTSRDISYLIKFQ